MYLPREDSEMLAEEVNKYAKGKVLDLGTGSGIQALSAAKSDRVKEVLAVDIDGEAIAYCHAEINNPKITFQVSDLFSTVKGKFDVIVFNPPYLPKDKGIDDLALYGGKKGSELIEKFFDKADEHLKQDGFILLLFSSHTNKDKVDKIIRERMYKVKLLNRKHIFFEDLYVYLVKK
ncbi:HemK2/MTQ2 family protein methyltransferase [Nanoarchaeota archaeon]